MPATAKQLSYLKALAERAGQTFIYPRTSAEASREIRRLRTAPRTGRGERAREYKQIADAIQAGPDNAAARVRADEIHGYGSEATWTQNRPQDPPAVEEPPAEARPSVGPRTELGRYAVDGHPRILWGQRVEGVVRVSDCPAHRGRSYLVERELHSKAELDALVAEYLRHAAKLGAIPMAAGA